MHFDETVTRQAIGGVRGYEHSLLKGHGCDLLLGRTTSQTLHQRGGLRKVMEDAVNNAKMFPLASFGRGNSKVKSISQSGALTRYRVTIEELRKVELFEGLALLVAGYDNYRFPFVSVNNCQV